MLRFPLVNLGSTRKTLGQWQCGYWKDALDKSASELSRWQQLFSQHPQYANNTQAYAQFQRAQDEWNKNKAEYDNCMNSANTNPYYGYPSWGPSTPPKPTPPEPPQTSENIPTPGATSGPEMPKPEYAPVATGSKPTQSINNQSNPYSWNNAAGQQANGAASSDNKCATGEWWDGLSCRSIYQNRTGGLISQAMNFGPSGGAQGISPGNFDFNPGSISATSFGGMGQRNMGRRSFPVVNL